MSVGSEAEAEALAPGGFALATQSVIALTGGKERGRNCNGTCILIDMFRRGGAVNRIGEPHRHKLCHRHRG